MGTSLKSFHPEHTYEWLEKGGYKEVIRWLTEGRERIRMAQDRSRRKCLNIGLSVSSSEQWLGLGLAAILSEQRVWFLPPVWKEEERRQVSDKVGFDLWWGDDSGIRTVSPKPSDDPEEPGIMICTGGSSGRVKFAWHTAGTLTQAVEGVARYFLQRSPEPGDFVYESNLPLWHVSGWMQFVRAFVSGSRWSINHEMPCAEKSVGNNRAEVRWLSLVPTQLRRHLESASREALKRADFVVVGGGPCPESLLKQAADEGVRIWSTYGMTETAGMIAARRVDPKMAAEEGAEILPHAEVKAVPLDGSENAEQLHVRASSLCLGFDHHRFSDSVLRKGYPSGDLGRIDDSGRLHLLGRMDLMINSGGEKILPGEVRKVVLDFPGVVDCQVVGLPDPEWGEKVACLWQPGKDAKVDPGQLRQFVSERLSSFKIPKVWRQVDRLPYDEKGKLPPLAISRLLSGCSLDAEK